MTVNERIKFIRKEKKLTMEAFGKRIGVNKTSISMIESGQNKPSGRTIRAICREFNIREEWLVNGTGEIYEINATLDALIQEFGFGEREKHLAELFLTLDANKRNIALEYVSEVVDALNSKKLRMEGNELVGETPEAESLFTRLRPEYKKYVLKQIDELLEIQDKENEEKRER